MKISLANGVVLDIASVNNDGKRKELSELRKEAATRCEYLGINGALLDDSFKVIARFKATGN